MAANNIKSICRLCGKKHEFLKDILEENNKNVFDLIRQFTQISVSECDDLPKRICLDCEEKLVSFQLFILECYKVQDYLANMYIDSCSIKEEELAVDFGAPVIKSEVKDELTAEDIVGAINSDNAYVIDDDNFYNDNDSDSNGNEDDDDEDDDDQDNVTIASLKEIKKETVKRKTLTEEEKKEFNNLLKKPDLRIKDLVKLQCHVCDSVMKSYGGLSVHYYKCHKTKPLVYCMCGYPIKSKSVLYKHVTEHKLDSKRLRKLNDSEESRCRNNKMDGKNVQDFVNFICFSCEKQCSSWYTLKSHCERTHKTAPIVRCACGVILKSKSVMYKHVQDHKNPNELSCDKCSLVAKSLKALNKHKMKHIPKSDRKYACSGCDKIFTNRDALKSHERSHIPIEERKIYHCEICDLKFTTRSSAASHRRVVHEKIKSYVCDLCGYACGTNGELRQHRAIHSDEKPFVCKTCSKPFKTYSNLKTHMDTHEATSYACFVCNRVLNSRRTLRKHLLVHEDKCRHICSYCNKAFKRRQTLKVHMYTHTGDKPLSCKWCDERFAYASTLRSHRLRCHPDKMATQAHGTYSAYSHVVQQENYIKNDLAAVGVTKNEVEAM